MLRELPNKESAPSLAIPAPESGLIQQLISIPWTPSQYDWCGPAAHGWIGLGSASVIISTPTVTAPPRVYFDGVELG
jgi:hypothetical protein